MNSQLWNEVMAVAKKHRIVLCNYDQNMIHDEACSELIEKGNFLDAIQKWISHN